MTEGMQYTAVDMAANLAEGEEEMAMVWSQIAVAQALQEIAKALRELGGNK